MDDVATDVATDILAMPASGPGSLEYFRNQVTASDQNIQSIASTRNWDANIQRYLGGKGTSDLSRGSLVGVNKDFSLTEAKKALLFFQTPDISAVASQPQYDPVAPLVSAVMNQTLSPRGVHAKAMVDECLMDVLCPSGIGVSKIGYEAFIDPQQPEMLVPDPANPTMPAMDLMTGLPVTQPNIVRERYFWQRVPPKMFGFPVTFTGLVWDEASWLSIRFELDTAVAQRVYGLKDEEVSRVGGSASREKDLLTSDVSRSTQSDVQGKVCFTEVWYRASDVDATIGDPEIIRQLVIMEGLDRPLVHRDSPYQTIEGGKRVAGMRGYPIHPLTIRYVSDQAIPPSDCSISRTQVDELSRGRSQMIQQRDRAMPLTAFDSSRVPPDTINRILKGETQELIPIPGMDAATSPFASIQRGTFPRENFSFNDIINRDIGEYWSLGQNQLGADTDTKRTATELSIINSATQTRMDAERVKVLDWYAKGAEKVLALVQMFADEPTFAKLAGPEGAQQLVQWSKGDIAGEYTITLSPDSSQRVDAAAEKKQAVDLYSLFGNDPLLDPVELRRVIFRKLGWDASKLIKPPQPKPPEPPQISVSVKGEDMNPMMPQYQNIVTLLAARGIGVQAPGGGMAPPMPPTNPGTMPGVTPIDKRTAVEQSGQLPGGGQAAAVQR